MRSLLAFCLILTACDASGDALDLMQADPIDLDALSQEPEALIGTWDWVASVSYYTLSGEPSLQTPKSTGQTQTYVFEAGGTARIYQNGTLARETTYTIERRIYSNGTQDARASLRFGTSGSIDFGTRDHALVLDSTPVDGPQSRYRRR